MKSPEGWEKDEICQYLVDIAAWYFRTFTAGYGKSGQPDIIACIDSMFWGIEVKREGKEPTVLQTRRMAEITNAGGFCAWGTADKVIREIEAWRHSRD